MCEYLKRMSPQDTPTDDIRLWSGLAHSVVEYTGPEPFGMDGSVHLWLHERNVTQLLDMCDELDAKFSGLKNENAKLREYAESYAKAVECEGCGWCPYDMDLACNVETMPMHNGCKLYDELRELGIEVE